MPASLAPAVDAHAPTKPANPAASAERRLRAGEDGQIVRNNASRRQEASSDGRGGRVQRSGGMSAAQRAQTEAIERETLTFWRAYLSQDASALETLCDLPERIAPVGVAELKADRCGGAER
jgi:hypothetical protein